MTTSPSDDPGLQLAADMFRALANPARIALLRLLVTPTTVTGLVEATGLSQPLVSQHLRVLRTVHLVRVTRAGREAIYQVSDGHITHVIEDAITHTAERPLTQSEVEGVPAEP